MDRIAAKNDAKAIMQRFLGTCVGANVFSSFISLAPFAIAPMTYGRSIFYLDILRNGKSESTKVLKGLNMFSRAVMLQIWIALFLLLWSLPSVVLEIIAVFQRSSLTEYILGQVISGFDIYGFYDAPSFNPIGIICHVLSFLCRLFVIYKAVQYSFAFYEMVDNPNLTAKECLSKAVADTNPYYDKIIITFLSFLGWDILSLITSGLVGLFYVQPYKELTYAQMYNQISGAAPAADEDGPHCLNAASAGPQTEPAVEGLRGMYAGTSFSISPGETIVIGRDGASSQIVVTDNAAKVSRRHCGVYFDQTQGVFKVTDYSSNGTFLGDGTKLPKEFPQIVPRGTVIYLGDQTNSFRLV